MEFSKTTFDVLFHHVPSFRRHRIHQSFANLGELYRFHLEIIDLGAGPVIPQHLWEPRSEEKSLDSLILEDDGRVLSQLG